LEQVCSTECRITNARIDLVQLFEGVHFSLSPIGQLPSVGLPLGGEWRDEDCDDRYGYRQNARHRSTLPRSASAFSSQNRMSISRYMALALVRCFSGFVRSPVRW
jgi:hypothetical protein